MSDLNVLDIPLKFQNGRDRAGDISSRCPYCLEIFTAEALARQQVRTCPICLHDILPTLLGCPLHLLNRRQQWAYLLNEMKFIWDWEYSCFSSIRRKPLGSLFEFHYEKAAFEDLCDAFHAMQAYDGSFLNAMGDLENMALDRLWEWGQRDGLMARDLLQGRPWRERAKELSAEGALPRPVVEFQLDYVGNLPGGVFTALQREEIILCLKDRLDQL